MGEHECTTLLEALADVPDPRCRRGRRYPWALLLTLVSAALASGQRNGRAIGQWVQEHHEELAAEVGRAAKPMPSEATLRRALRTVDVGALEARLGEFAAELGAKAPPSHWHGLAVDGKAVRGAQAHGRAMHLVEAVRHDGIVLRQTAVAAKSSEITAAPRLLAGQNLAGIVVTVDALLTQRAFAQQIRQQGGHYLMVVKEDQPALLAAIELLFAEPPEGGTAAETVARTTTKGHGRLEWRTLETSSALQGWLNWPDHRQVLRRTCRRVRLATGEVQEQVTYGVTSLDVREANAALLERFWRGHWTIENRVHYVRDVTWGEDAGQARVGSTPQALAALRNALLSLLRFLGWTSIADALRHYSAAVHRALQLVGAPPRL